MTRGEEILFHVVSGVFFATFGFGAALIVLAALGWL